MKKTITILPLFLLSCILLNDDPVESTSTFFILCEGAFGAPNATLWTADESFEESTGPIYWDPNQNPLGDTGQSMGVYNDQLFIVLNNSHTIEVMDLSGDGATFNRSIWVENAGPRFIEFYGDRAFISCWNLNGILVMDLNTDAYLDTIDVGGKPEDLLIAGSYLYSAITLDDNWAPGDQVKKINLNSYTIDESYTVLQGPSRMVESDGLLFISNVYYDLTYTSYYGTSSIELSSGETQSSYYGISQNYGHDIIKYNGEVYRTVTNGVARLNTDLSVDSTTMLSNYTGTYSLGASEDYLLIGTTDYSAPDVVYVLDENGVPVNELVVGAIPTDFIQYDD